jgi:hypothetical protein
MPHPTETVWDCTVSPRGDRIGWITLRAAEQRFVDEVCDLWTSDIDGGNVNVVGSQPCVLERSEEGDDRDRYHFARGLKWLPDGERVSFMFHGAMWVVGVGR